MLLMDKDEDKVWSQEEISALLEGNDGLPWLTWEQILELHPHLTGGIRQLAAAEKAGVLFDSPPLPPKSPKDTSD